MKRQPVLFRGPAFGPYKVLLAGGQFYRLMEYREKAVKRRHWVTIAIGTKALERVADRLNDSMRASKPVLWKRKRIAMHH